MSDRYDEALTYLKTHHVATLASTGPRGPWAAAVFYANVGFTLFFVSSPSSRHIGDLEQDSRCAAAIHENYPDWREIRGLQLDGEVGEVPDRERATAQAIYVRRFPFVEPALAAPAIGEALEGVAWYQFVPYRCLFIDNTIGFGHRDEILLR